MGGGLPLRLWYLQGWVRSSSAQSSRPEWPAFSSVRAARTSATERAFCVPCASSGRRDRGNPGPSPHPAGGRQIECRNNVGCRILVVFKGAGFDFSLATLSGGRAGPPPSALLFARIQMHLSVRDDRNISSTLQELHHL